MHLLSVFSFVVNKMQSCHRISWIIKIQMQRKMFVIVMLWCWGRIAVNRMEIGSKIVLYCYFIATRWNQMPNVLNMWWPEPCNWTLHTPQKVIFLIDFDLFYFFFYFWWFFYTIFPIFKQIRSDFFRSFPFFEFFSIYFFLKIPPFIYIFSYFFKFCIQLLQFYAFLA